MGKVIAVCTSRQKGTQKRNVGSARFRADWGIENDALLWTTEPLEKIWWWRATISNLCR